MGRFLNADAYVSTGQGFIGHNTFAYCSNNPVLRADPSGSISIAAFLAGVASISLSGLASASVNFTIEYFLGAGSISKSLQAAGDGFISGAISGIPMVGSIYSILYDVCQVSVMCKEHHVSGKETLAIASTTALTALIPGIDYYNDLGFSYEMMLSFLMADFSIGFLPMLASTSYANEICDAAQERYTPQKSMCTTGVLTGEPPVGRGGSLSGIRMFSCIM